MKHDFVKFPLYLIVHPFDGFWELKYDEKGKVKVALTILLMVIISLIIQAQFAGFLVNYNDPRTLNSLSQFTAVILPFILWCVSNWAITTLMDGEGKFKEIVMATAYALLPLVMVYVPATIASRFLVIEEISFYYLPLAIATIWFVGLLFVGTMTIHQYNIPKTIFTMLLTVVVMGLIIFLGALVLSMFQQIVEFGINIYRELAFRI